VPTGRLVDSHGRVVRDLRISVTDRCNFRCTYCMPEEGLEWLPRSEILSYEEIARVARVCVERLGFESIRLTGGEPTVRPHLDVLVEQLSSLRRPSGDPVDLALTTNGATLGLLAGELSRAGLTRINVSCDSLRRDRFRSIARRDRLDAVLDGIDAAISAGLSPVKVNVVVMRDVNHDEIVDFATFGREHGVEPRFIEFMPLDADEAWRRESVVPASEIIAAIDSVYPLDPLSQGSEPATRYRYRDGAGTVGVIASVTRPFCGDCDRIRLTTEGKIRTCLFAVDEHDLRHPLRSGASDEDLASMIESAVGTKWAGHRIGRVDFVRPPRSMSQIGG
jgi:GTP 3',8-cyclase